MICPFVSIICPLHNKEEFVSETIESVLAQSFENWELIIVENGSSDNGLEVVRSYEDPRIRIFISSKCGPGAARNLGISYAIGYWVMFLDADDLIAPEYLKEQLNIATQSPEADLVVGCWSEFKSNSENSMELIVQKPVGYHGNTQEVLVGAVAFAPWAIHAALIKRDQNIKALHWPEDLDDVPSEDTAFWFSFLLQKKRIAWSKSEGALYRVGIDDSRNASPASMKWFLGLKRVIEANLSTAKCLNIKITSAQYEAIMRTFEGRFISAQKRGDGDVSDLFLLEANKFLSKCVYFKLTVLLRKIFGIKLYAQLIKRI